MSRRNPCIVVDARMAQDGGIGTYIQALLPRIAAIRPQWTFRVLGHSSDMQALGWDRVPNVDLLECAARIFSIREQIELPLRCQHGADLFWAPHYNVPAAVRVPLVVTIHDVNHLALPELMGSALRRTYARWMLTSAVTRAHRVLFVSEFTRRETERVLRTAMSTGVVVHSAADVDWARARLDAPERPIAGPYLVYVGNIKRHKNLPLLLRAFHRVRQEIPHQLVLIGRTNGLRADPDIAAALEPLNGRAMLLGELDKPTLRRYVAHADALVTASLYEGFGLPPLEAMTAGCPCLVSSAGSLPEVCGDAAHYADPRDEIAFASGLVAIARNVDLRARLIARGRDRAAEFSWDRSAEQTVAVLEQALS